MKALAVDGGRVRVVERPDPRPAEDEAMVRVLLAGICGTDLEIARGYMGFRGIPGHEFVGVVEECRADPGRVGRRVVGEINAGCGRCEWCGRGLARHCPQRTVLGISGRDGAFAERLTLPVASLHDVPEAVPDEVAVFTEPLAAAHEILEQVSFPPEARVLVLGAGRLGQLCALALAHAGIRSTASDRHPRKLARLERLGLPTLDPGRLPPHGFDVIVEATGSPDGLGRALDLVRPRGTVVLKSTCHEATTLPLSTLVIDEITVIGSRCGPFEPALELLARAPRVCDGLVTARFALDEAEAAFECASRSDAFKVLLAP